MKKTVAALCLLAFMVTLSGCDGRGDNKEYADGTQETQYTAEVCFPSP